MQPIFITGIGTGIGKTVVSAILVEALQADYWKPIQAGFDQGTDTEWIRNNVSNSVSRIHPELYRLRLAASPHIAAREEFLKIDVDEIVTAYNKMAKQASANDILIIEGAGGLMVPLNENEFVIELIRRLNAKVMIVSKNYLGSINHSLLTAIACKTTRLDVIGWIFNDQYLHYEEEIVHWSGFPSILSVPYTENPDRLFIRSQAARLSPELKSQVMQVH